jgi:integrase
VLPELQQAIDAMRPHGQLAFLISETGRPFKTAASFGVWFRKRCNEAGIPKFFAFHGLRKAGATLFAEHGFTDHEIMSWGGWKTLREVQRYTAAANRKKMAMSGAEKLGAAGEQK